MQQREANESGVRSHLDVLADCRKNEHESHRLRAQGLTVVQIAGRLGVWPP